MDAAPFRQFLSLKVCASKEDLSEAVGVDKGADVFCAWVLDLRLEWRRRRSVGEYIQQRDRRTVDCLPDQWFCVAEQEIFNIWCVLHKSCRPRAKRAVGVQPKSRVQRRCLAHMGQCFTMYPPLQFKEQLRAPVFGRPWKVNPLFYGLIIFLDVTSGLCLVMRTGPLIVQLVLSYS